jgi:imidazolonepropionase-like amidohydrolase
MIGPRLSGTSAILDGTPRVWPNSLELTSARQAEETVDRLAAEGAEAFKVYNNLTVETYRAIVERARHHDKAVVGHAPRAVGARGATEAGQKSLEHLDGIAEECAGDAAAQTRGDGADTRARRTMLIDTYDARRCESLSALFVRNGTWQVPTLILHRGRLLAFEASRMRAPELAYASASEYDAWAAMHARNVQNVTGDASIPAFRRKVLSHLLQITADMHRAGVGILAGTDLGNPWVVAGFSLHDELALFVEAGMTPLEALQTATVNPARYLNRTDSLGAIEAGKLADFVLLAANPLTDIANTKTIRAVVTNGRYLDRQALDALLAKARVRQER